MMEYIKKSLNKSRELGVVMRTSWDEVFSEQAEIRQTSKKNQRFLATVDRERRNRKARTAATVFTSRLSCTSLQQIQK